MICRFSAFHSVVIVCAGDIRLYFKLLLKFRNTFEHTGSRSSLGCNQDIKKEIPKAGFGSFFFALKGNEMTYM